MANTEENTQQQVYEYSTIQQRHLILNSVLCLASFLNMSFGVQPATTCTDEIWKPWMIPLMAQLCQHLARRGGITQTDRRKTSQQWSQSLTQREVMINFKKDLSTKNLTAVRMKNEKKMKMCDF